MCAKELSFTPSYQQQQLKLLIPFFMIHVMMLKSKWELNSDPSSVWMFQQQLKLIKPGNIFPTKLVSLCQPLLWLLPPAAGCDAWFSQRWPAWRCCIEWYIYFMLSFTYVVLLSSSLTPVQSPESPGTEVRFCPKGTAAHWLFSLFGPIPCKAAVVFENFSIFCSNSNVYRNLESLPWYLFVSIIYLFWGK